MSFPMMAHAVKTCVASSGQLLRLTTGEGIFIGIVLKITSIFSSVRPSASAAMELKWFQVFVQV